MKVEAGEAESSDAIDTSSHVRFVLSPAPLVSVLWRWLPEACQKGAFLLQETKGCLRDKSFPHPEVVAFPRLAALRKPERKRLGR